MLCAVRDLIHCRRLAPHICADAQWHTLRTQQYKLKWPGTMTAEGAPFGAVEKKAVSAGVGVGVRGEDTRNHGMQGRHEQKRRLSSMSQACCVTGRRGGNQGRSCLPTGSPHKSSQREEREA